ncbi:MAG: DUF159 family protein [Archangium gephyra]|uniref:Abasic site processing protein n=1 Tax=Archangium gephyra TaxID=48 RepID=A0A2W5TEH3_9BACT|nr:MAG: DUF159 family protein [Archangium gephyra]
MCARYSLNASSKQLAEELKLSAVPAWVPRFNLAPTQECPVIMSAAPEQAKLARFGLLPRWAKDVKIASRFINARSEKLLSHGTYKALVTSHRCVVPMSGFYEWTEDKRPYFVSDASGALSLAAGLWSTWTSQEDVSVDTFTILTCAPSKELAKLHDRMPVLLDDEGRMLWLSKSEDVDRLMELMAPREGLALREVSKRVNNVNHEGPELLEPPKTAQLDLLR